jgi:hypothetical protein
VKLSSLIDRFADNANPQSVASRLRRRRFEQFLTMLHVSSSTSILDVGGTEFIWLGTGLEKNVTLLNIGFEARRAPFRYLACDACNLGHVADAAYDVVYSNSVVEHVGSFEAQQMFAREVRRVGRRYWVQTPNRHFPIEPHFLFPMFHSLPAHVKRAVALRWPYSHPLRCGMDVLEELRKLRPLDTDEMQKLFPDAQIVVERWLGMVKSLIACR